MQRWALGIEFNGQDYRGWQTQQAGVRSVQQTLEAALSRVANHPVIVHAAGRTDAGVHASNMVIHFDSPSVRQARSWIMGANTLLPRDIAVRWAVPMTDDFHARFKAIARRYRYVILNHPYRPALLSGQVTHVYQTLDIAKMQLAAAKFVGTHDFSSFRAVACQSNQPVRTVSHCQLIQQGQLLILDIQANGFLHHMVRNLVGALLMVGKGGKPAEWMAELLAARSRASAPPTFMPDGLYLTGVRYPEEFGLPSPPPLYGPRRQADV